jgi:hypothetical protein
MHKVHIYKKNGCWLVGVRNSQPGMAYEVSTELFNVALRIAGYWNKRTKDRKR